MIVKLQTSAESFEWANGPFEEGHRNRFDGMRRDSAPSADVVGDFAHRSWLAGWDDADAAIRTEGLDIPVHH